MKSRTWLSDTFHWFCTVYLIYMSVYFCLCICGGFFASRFHNYRQFCNEQLVICAKVSLGSTSSRIGRSGVYTFLSLPNSPPKWSHTFVLIWAMHDSFRFAPSLQMLPTACSNNYPIFQQLKFCMFCIHFYLLWSSLVSLETVHFSSRTYFPVLFFFNLENAFSLSWLFPLFPEIWLR